MPARTLIIIDPANTHEDSEHQAAAYIAGVIVSLEHRTGTCSRYQIPPVNCTTQMPRL